MSTILTVGAAPTHMSFWDESAGRMADESDMQDAIAKIVMQRFRDARQHKQNNNIYQGKSTVTLLREADYAMQKRYTPEQERGMSEAFGFCPSRYYGLIQAKVTEVAGWKSELVNSDPGMLIQIAPTPKPRLTEASIKRIKEEVKQDLVRRMMEMGVGDPNMLIKVGSNRLHENVKQFLDEKADVFRRVEQAKIVQQATAGAAEMQVLMRDVIVEADFRDAYSSFATDQVKYGVSVLRFPYWQRRVVLADRQDSKGSPERKWKTVPTFRHVTPWNFFCLNDARDVSTNTANMEYTELSKSALVGLAKDSRYDRAAIEWILQEYSFKSRAWLFPESSELVSESGQSATYWSPDEIVAVIFHEGYLTGQDLQEYGLSGYESSRIYNVVAEVCCGRTIRIEVKDPTAMLPRGFCTAKYEDLGPGIWNAVGIPAILQNTQDEVNIMLHGMNNNMDWSLRPPLQTNPDALKNPNEARNIRPGGKYEVSDMIAPGTSPDPIRTIRGPSAQYQIVWPLILQKIRQSDVECGIPSLSDFNTLGRGSLGEFSARVSGAVRRVRNAAFSEDRGMKRIWETLWEYTIEENPEMVDSIDLTFNYVGVAGLLAQEAESKAKSERLAMVMQGMQTGMVPQEVGKFVWQDMLKDSGIPTEALGMSDPLTENAIALAVAQGPITSGAGAGGLAGAPQLDGRSGSISSVPTAVSAPNGGSALANMAPPPAM